VGTGSTSGSQNMVGTNVHQVMQYPAAKLDGLLHHMLAIGLNVDVPTSAIVDVLGATTGKTPEHLGPYVGRFNLYMQRRGYSHRLVVGNAFKSYRLISL